MIIHKLEMYNFRQYIDLQEISFSTDPEKNVTVLIGVNTSGKTTIIRAFEWCLYGKNGFEDPVLLNSEVRDNMNVGDTQEVWVAVTFSHEDSNGQKIYTLKRKYTYLCNEKTKAEGKLVVSLNKKPEEDLSLTYLQSDGQQLDERIFQNQWIEFFHRIFQIIFSLVESEFLELLTERIYQRQYVD